MLFLRQLNKWQSSKDKRDAKKAHIIFEEKLRREFDKLDENLKKEIINKSDLFFKGKK